MGLKCTESFCLVAVIPGLLALNEIDSSDAVANMVDSTHRHRSITANVASCQKAIILRSRLLTNF